MGRGRPELWENVAVRALSALAGEASELEILRWVQDNRPGLRSGWQTAVLTTLRAHGDGRGKAYFESVPEKPRCWRLPGYVPHAEPQLAATPLSSQVPQLGKLVTKALADGNGDGFSAVEHYCLALVAYKVGWYGEAVMLIDKALANGLEGSLRAEAAHVRSICLVKAELGTSP